MAVSIVLFFGAFLPLLGILVAPFSPLPLCILTVKYGLRHGLMVALITIGVLSVLFSIVLGGAFIPFVFVGLVLGALARRRSTGLRALVGGTLATLMLLLGLFYLYEYVASNSQNLMTIREFWNRKFERTDEVIGDLETSVFKGNKSVTAPLRANLRTLQWMVSEVFRFPLAFFSTLAALGFAMSYFVANRMLKKLGLLFPDLPEFSKWQGTKEAVALFSACYLMTMYCWRTEALREWRVYAINILFLLFVYHLILGLSLLEFNLRRRGTDSILRVIVHLLALRFLTFPPAPLLTTLALLDPWFDFRNLALEAAPAIETDNVVLEKGDG